MIIEGEVVSTEVATVDVETRVAALRPLDGAAQAAQVTMMLSQARTGLLAAIAAHDLESLREFKAKASAIHEIAKQVRLGKDMQTDAAEFCRRAERGLGIAIRVGQSRGEVRTHGQRSVVVGDQNSYRPSPTDFASQSELSGSGSGPGIYDIVDDISDAVFEEAIADAREEENLSRANVARKCKAKGRGVEPEVRPTSSRMAQTRRAIDNMAMTIGNLAKEVNYISAADVDPHEMKEEITCILKSMDIIRKFLRSATQ